MIIDTLQLVGGSYPQLVGGSYIGCAIKANGRLRFRYDLECKGPPSIIEQRETFLIETINKALEELRQEAKQSGDEDTYNRYSVTSSIDEYDAFITGIDIEGEAE